MPCLCIYPSHRPILLLHVQHICRVVRPWDTCRQHVTCPRDAGAQHECDAPHTTLSSISTSSGSRRERHVSGHSPPSVIFTGFILTQRNDLGCSLCCNSTAGNFGSGSSLNCQLWYEHSVESAELFTCEMSIAVIVIKAKTAPDDGAVAKIPKSDSEKT